jgi:hypothetical protein
VEAFENKVLRGIFGSKTEEVTRSWRKVDTEELHDLYCSPYYGDGQVKEPEVGGSHINRRNEVKSLQTLD